MKTGSCSFTCLQFLKQKTIFKINFFASWELWPPLLKLQFFKINLEQDTFKLINFIEIFILLDYSHPTSLLIIHEIKSMFDDVFT